MSRRSSRGCPACAGSAVILVHSLKLKLSDGHPLQGGYDVVSCEQCGTGYADVDLPQEVYDAYYAADAKYAEDEGILDTVGGGDWALERASGTADRIAALVRDHRARILDVGCANGSLLRALRERGYSNVQGIDPSPRSATIARDVHGLEVIVGTLAEMPSVPRADAVVLTGVLEHLWDVDQAVRVARRLLRPGGIVYVEVPDASRYLDPFVGPFEDFNSEHINHFSLGALSSLAERFGLSTVWRRSVDIQLAPGVESASAASAWQARDGASPRLSITRDDGLVESLLLFTRSSLHAFEAIDRKLRRRLGRDSSFILWGTGEFSAKLLAMTVLGEHPIEALVDANSARQRQWFDGRPVMAPEQLVGSETPIVIGSVARAQHIADAVARSGLPNPVVRLDGN